MQRQAFTIAVLSLAITAAFGAYALQAPAPAPSDPAPSDPAVAVTPDADVSGIEIGIQEAADMACSRLIPHANDDYWTTAKNTPITASPLANDPDNEQQNFGGITSGPSHGTAQVVGLDAVKYTPNTNYVGSDSFNYLHVGCLQCFQGYCSEPETDEGTVHITVTN